MCEHCRSIPHLNGCPMADDPPVYTFCDQCGGPIYVSETYYHLEVALLCEQCVNDGRMTAEE